jgi:predicted Zn-dependent protease
MNCLKCGPACWLSVMLLVAGQLSADEDDYVDAASGLMQRTAEDQNPTQAVLGILANANELLSQRRFEEAAVLLNNALVHYPDSKHIRYMQAAVLVSLDRYADAIGLLETYLAQYPGDYRLMNNLSWIFSTARDLRFRNPSRALDLAQDAVLQVPGDYHVWSTLAEAHYVNANFEQGLKALQHGIELAASYQADAGTMRTYQQQWRKIEEAASVMSLIE